MSRIKKGIPLVMPRCISPHPGCFGFFVSEGGLLVKKFLFSGEAVQLSGGQFHVVGLVIFFMKRGSPALLSLAGSGVAKYALVGGRCFYGGEPTVIRLDMLRITSRLHPCSRLLSFVPNTARAAVVHI